MQRYTFLSKLYRTLYKRKVKVLLTLRRCITDSSQKRENDVLNYEKSKFYFVKIDICKLYLLLMCLRITFVAQKRIF